MTDVKSRVDVFGILSVRLRHSTAQLAELSRSLGLATAHQWKASDVLHRGPNLPPRLRGENYWASEIVLHRREFAEALSDVLRALQKRQVELADFVHGGGKLELYLQLNGAMNAGDSLSAELLNSLADLKAELQIEVFPDFGPNTGTVVARRRKPR